MSKILGNVDTRKNRIETNMEGGGRVVIVPFFVVQVLVAIVCSCLSKWTMSKTVEILAS